MGALANFGAESIRRMEIFGDFCRFCGRTFGWLRSGLRWRNLRHVTPRLYEVGAASVPVVMTTGAFVGAVLAVQAVAQFRAVGLASRLGTVVNMSVLRELGPILAAVILAGRVGGGLTAELGTMRVTEQLDALRVMGADPIRVLVVPRLLACTLLIPALVVYGSFTGILGGYFASVYLYGVNSTEFWRYASQSVGYYDIFLGPIKSVFFGAMIGLICCYKGFRCESGAAGVGRACTQGFVACCLAILVLDLFLGMFFNSLYQMFFTAKSIL
jgi:phospholipid/cholesterol/gamma-HCH transport system permease protein